MALEEMEAVRRLVDAFNARDPEAASAVLTEDAEWRPAYTGGGAVEGAVYRGHAGFRRYLEDLSEPWTSIEGFIDELRVVGQQVLLFGRMHFVGRRSGVEMTQSITGLFTFRDGKVAAARYYIERDEAIDAADAEG